MPPPDKVSTHEFAHRARLKWIDEFPGWADDEVVRGVLAKYPGDAEHVDVDTRKLFNNHPQLLASFHANRYGVDPQLVRRMMKQESGGNRGAVSPKGASGLMQLMPDTARAMGVKDIFDPYENVEAGVKYFKTQLDRFKDPALALAAYNAGPERVAKHGKVPNIPETQNYVSSILKGYSAPSQTPPVQQNQQIPQQPSQTRGEQETVPPPRPQPAPVDPNSVAAAPWFNAGRIAKQVGRMRPLRDPIRFAGQPSLETYDTRGIIPTNQEPVTAGMGNVLQSDERTRNIRAQLKEKQLAGQRALVSNPNSAEARLYDPHRDINAEAVKLSAEQESTEKENQRLLAQFTDEDWKQAQDISDQLKRHGPGVLKGVDTAAQETSISLLTTLAGMLAYAGPDLENQGVDTIRRKALAGQLALQDVENLPKPVSEHVFHELASMAFSFPEIAAAVGVGGPIGGFAGLEALKAKGRNEPIAGQLRAGLKGGLTGVGFKLAGTTGSVPKELATVGTTTFGVEKLFGASDAEAARSAASNVVFSGGSHALHALPSVGLKGLDYAVDKVGTVRERRAVNRAGERIAAQVGIADPASVEGLARGRMITDLDLPLGREFKTGVTAIPPEKSLSLRPVDADPAAVSVGIPAVEPKPTHAANRRERTESGTFIEGAAKGIPTLTKPSSTGFAEAFGSSKNAATDSFVRDAWNRLSKGKSMLHANAGSLEDKIQKAFDDGQIKGEADIRPIVNQHFNISTPTSAKVIKASDLPKAEQRDLKFAKLSPDTEFELRDINISDLTHFGHPFVEEAGKREPHPPAKAAGPIVLRSNLDIVGGTHRADAAFRRGDKTIQAWVEVSKSTPTQLTKTADKTNEFGNRIVRYETTTPEGKQVEVSLAIDPKGTAVPTVGVKGEGGEIVDDVASLGTKGVLELKKQILALHPEIKQLEFNRGGSTGGKKDRFRKLNVLAKVDATEVLEPLLPQPKSSLEELVETIKNEQISSDSISNEQLAQQLLEKHSVEVDKQSAALRDIALRKADLISKYTEAGRQDVADAKKAGTYGKQKTKTPRQDALMKEHSELEKFADTSEHPLIKSVRDADARQREVDIELEKLGYRRIRANSEFPKGRLEKLETRAPSHVSDEQRAELRMRELSDEQINNMSSKDVERALAPEVADPPIVAAAKRRKKAKVDKFADDLKKAGVDPKDIDDIEFRHAGLPIDLNDIIIKGYDLIKKAKEKLEFDAWADLMRESFKGNDIESDLTKVWSQVGRFTGTVKADLPIQSDTISEIKTRREAFDQMVARGVPDEDFKSLLSTYKTPLQKYETWKSRAARVIKADEKRYGLAKPETLVEKAFKAAPPTSVTQTEGGKKTFKVERPKAEVQAASTTGATAAREDVHRTLDIEGENRDLADDAARRIWDIFTANTKANKNPPTWEAIKAEMNRVLPRTRKNEALLRRAFDSVDIEFNPREPVPLGEPLAEKPLGPATVEQPRIIPSTADETAVRNFAQRLEDRGLPFGLDVIRRVHHDPQVQKAAFDRIAKNGIKDTHAWVLRDEPSKKEVGDEQVAAGITLIKIYHNQGERTKADEIASTMARKLSDSARILRAAQFIDELSPEGILTQANQDLQRNFGNDRMKRFTADQSAQITDAATAAYRTKEELHKNTEKQGTLTPEALAEAKKRQIALKPKARLLQRSGEAAAAAQERIDYRKARLRMGVSDTKLHASIPGLRAIHPDLPELIVIGADKILKGAVGLQEFTSEMVKEYGQDIRPFVEQVYRGAGQDVLQRRRRERLEQRIEKVTKGKPEDYSSDEIEELLRLDSEVVRQKAKNWSELRQRAEFGYPKKEARPRVKANPEGPEKPEDLALMINKLGGADAASNVIVGAIKLMRTTPKEWETEMEAERGLDLKADGERVYTESYELFKEAQRQLAIERTIKRKGAPNLTHEEQVAQAEKLLFEQKVLREKLSKQRRDLGKVYRKFTMTEEQKFRATIYDLAMIPKALKASLDLSAPGRQGWVLISGAGIKGRAAQKAAMSMMVENALSKTWYENNVETLKNHVRFDQAERNGLHLTSPSVGDSALVTLTPREESFASEAADLIPLVARSNRAYSGYLDAARIGYFDIFAREMESRGVTEMSDPQAYKDIAKMINTFTGRGQLKHESVARAFNLLTWSPRFMKSRFQFLNPKWYKDLHPEARRIAMRTAVRSLGTNFALLSLASIGGSALGFSVNLLNPDDPDWLKIRHGDTRYDISGGHVPVARFMYKIAKNLNNARQGNWSEVKEPWEILGDFLRTKEAPIPAFAHMLYTGKDFKGEKLTEKVAKTPLADIFKKTGIDPNAKFPQWTEATLALGTELFAPMVGEDFLQALDEEGFMGVAKTFPASFIGVGVSTYKDKGRFALRGFAKEELNRLGIASPTIMGQKTGLRSFDDEVEKQLISAIQVRVEKEKDKDRYKKATDEQKIRIMRNLLDDVRESARHKAEAKLTKEDRRELNRLREKRYGK